MWLRNAIIAIAVAALAGGCQVRPLYMDTATGGPLSPTPDLMAIAVDPPRDRTEQVLTNELSFIFRGDGSRPTEPLYRLRKGDVEFAHVL